MLNIFSFACWPSEFTYCFSVFKVKNVPCVCAQSYLTLCNPMNCIARQAPLCSWNSPAISFSRESSQSRDLTCASCVSCIGRWILHHWATWEAKNVPSVQFSHSVVSDSATPWIAARQASLSITNSWSSLKLVSIESVMPSSHLILCHPLLLLPSIPPSISIFSNESTLRMRWPKYRRFNFSISSSK